MTKIISRCTQIGTIAAGLALGFAAVPAHAEDGTNLCGYMGTVVMNMKDVKTKPGTAAVIGKIGVFYEVSKNDSLRDTKCDEALQKIWSGLQNDPAMDPLPHDSVPYIRIAWNTPTYPADSYDWERQRFEGSNPGDVVYQQFCNTDISNQMAVGSTYSVTCANGKVTVTKK